MTSTTQNHSSFTIGDAERALGAATVYEANAQTGALDPAIHQVVPGLSVMGRALTVSCAPGDNLTLHAAVAHAEPGDVIVADVGSYSYAGHWGEILAIAAQSRGVAGLVINGGVRDIEMLARHRFPCFAAATCMRAAVKKHLGRINEPIVIGDVLVHPGDLVCGDADGVVVVAKDRAQEVLRLSIEREAKEVGLMEQLRAGHLTLDLLSLRSYLEQS
jgi:4-hydroxy-4-methyl-2-oxoglutarate aldolase